ncbi:MAG TPA: hypothetical protein VLZ12_05615, partial [Verrucomicrobiae bacterium]|nr:hypothetical protein [Verrucomicrobiae bacterium]
MKHNQAAVIAAAATFLLGIAPATFAGQSAVEFRNTYGPLFQHPPVPPVWARPKPPHGSSTLEHVLYWNKIAVDASGLDHTPPAPGENRVWAEQYGPCRASRAMAIVHIAMFDAFDAIAGGYESYTGIAPARGRASIEAAIAQAAHDTLVALFPAQAATMDGLLADDLDQMRITDKHAKTSGIAVGHRAAAA